jgi:hypothetical protein
VRGFERQHVGCFSILKSLFELAVPAVAHVSNNGLESNAHLHRSLDRPKGYLRLGAELRVVLAAREVVSGGVGVDLQRVVKALVGLQVPHKDYPIVYLADTAQILLAHVGGRLAVSVGKGERPPQEDRRGSSGGHKHPKGGEPGNF